MARKQAKTGKRSKRAAGAKPVPENHLYFGDNLDILRRHIKDESIDLVYLDPPFNSKTTYNVLFAEQDGSRSAAQIKAFGDTWKWDEAAVLAYNDSLQMGGRVAETMRGFHAILGDSNMMAYVAMMAPRLVELHRVLKLTGSIYLHCDPTASHYLKLLMDAVFGAQRFRNEIIWERTTGRKGTQRFGRVHDTILFYAKSTTTTWNAPTVPQTEDTVRGHDLIRDSSGIIFRLSDFSGAGQGPPRFFGDKLIAPPAGRHWQYEQEEINRLMDQGRIFFSRGGRPRLKTKLEDLPSISVRDIWIDIEPINAAAAERLGYPTQKPEALLERIIQASSNEANVVLDPFCGCGTAVAVAHRLRRKWIGIDITYLAIDLIKRRLDDAFDRKVRSTYDVTGEPTSLSEANALAGHDRYQFQLWALGLVDARPAGVQKGADRGIDGRLYFHDEGEGNRQTKQVILSVKSGAVGVKDVRDLDSVVGREGAAIGVLITLEEPTRPMRAEAAEAGEYVWPFGSRKFPKIQILTVQELLEGRRIDMPPRAAVSNLTFKRARRAKENAETSVQNGLPFEETSA